MLDGLVLCRGLGEFPAAPRLEENGSTFYENALQKAQQAALWLSTFPFDGFREVMVLADDSGLEVDALGGAPGVHSARYAATVQCPTPSDEQNVSRLIKELKGRPFEQRTARFRCVLALVNIPPTEVWFFEGVCEGHIVDRPRGKGGFGYDPIFQPIGYALTFGELPAAVKNQISHRARALNQLRQWLVERAFMM